MKKNDLLAFLFILSTIFTGSHSYAQAVLGYAIYNGHIKFGNTNEVPPVFSVPGGDYRILTAGRAMGHDIKATLSKTQTVPSYGLNFFAEDIISNEAQNWEILPFSSADKTFIIRNKKDNYCLSEKNDRANLELFSERNAASFKWRFVKIDDNQYQIVSNKNKALKKGGTLHLYKKNQGKDFYFQLQGLNTYPNFYYRQGADYVISNTFYRINLKQDDSLLYFQTSSFDDKIYLEFSPDRKKHLLWEINYEGYDQERGPYFSIKNKKSHQFFSPSDQPWQPSEEKFLWYIRWAASYHNTGDTFKIISRKNPDKALGLRSIGTDMQNGGITSLPGMVNVNDSYTEFTLTAHNNSHDARATISSKKDYDFYTKPGEVCVRVINDDLRQKQIELAVSLRFDEALTMQKESIQTNKDICLSVPQRGDYFLMVKIEGRNLSSKQVFVP